jgi:hypothetical protein
MQYPTLSSAKAINFASKTSFSPYYDIVWSFDYAISGNQNTEAGFTVFLSRGDTPLYGGSGGIDLGYSGLSSSLIERSYIKGGIVGAAIGVGFDTTGLFAASAYDVTYKVRDGIDSSNVIKNSVTIRGISSYSYNQYSYHQPLSGLNSTFSIVESTEVYKTVRVRLGNIGRTLYIDYRNNPNEEFQPILQKEINILINKNVTYCPGISFATPISSISPAAIGNIFVKNIHTEGGVL